MTAAKYTPELMEPEQADALTVALEKLLNDKASAVWPAAHDAKVRGEPIELTDVEIVVLPLDRIGAPPGASGAKVFIAYYAHTPKSTKSRTHIVSHPFSVKVGKSDKLKTELDAVIQWPTLQDSQKLRFAFPFHIEEGAADKSILVAPFRSRFVDEGNGTRNRIKLGDLWSLLMDRGEVAFEKIPREDDVVNIISDALDAMQCVHRDNLSTINRESRRYVELYESYLRGTCSLTKDATRTHIPRNIFGDTHVVSAFGQEWPNPSIVIQRLISSKNFHNFCIGPVHGDLHSKNIVLDNSNQVRIIDFGWARGGAHVVLDYLFLDINLRGTTLPSQLSESDALALANFLRPEQNVSKLPKVVQSRARIISEVIWHRAKERAVENWVIEYLAPMLLVSYGLLVHLDNVRNQPAMLASVLSLSRELDRNVDL